MSEIEVLRPKVETLKNHVENLVGELEYERSKRMEETSELAVKVEIIERYLFRKRFPFRLSSFDAFEENEYEKYERFLRTVDKGGFPPPSW